MNGEEGISISRMRGLDFVGERDLSGGCQLSHGCANWGRPAKTSKLFCTRNLISIGNSF